MRTDATIQTEQQKGSFTPFVQVNLIDQSYTTSANTTIACYGAIWLAQTFTPSVSHFVGRIRLNLARAGSPGNITVSIRATDVDGKPTGADLSAVTQSGNGIAVTAEWVEFVMTPAFMSAGTKYVIVMRAPDGSASNRLIWTVDSVGPAYSGGQRVSSTDSGTTWELFAQDFYFEEYGVDSGRLLGVSHREEPYGASAVVRINNHDGAYSALTFHGQELQIGWGVNVAGTPSVSYAPTLWVTGHQLISAPGRKEMVIYAEGAWSKLRRWVADADYQFNQDVVALQSYTIKEIIDYILTKAGMDLGADIGSLDGQVDALEPVYTVPVGMDGATAVKRLLEITKCVLRPRTNVMHLMYPTDSDAVDYTYVSDSAHVFESAMSQSMVFKPMKVTVVDKLEGGTYTGSYAWGDGGETPAWSTEMGLVTKQYGSVVASNAIATFIATALVQKAASDRETGQVTALMNCLQEIYDRVTITDNRDGTGGTGRVGGIYRDYQPGAKRPYSINVRLGGLLRTLPTDLQGLIENIGTASGSMPLIPGTYLMPRTISPDLLQRAMQPYAVNLVFEAKDNDEIFWHGAAGAGNNGLVTFADGSTLTVTEKTSAAALTLTATHFIYFDLRDPTPGTLKSSTSYEDVVATGDRGLVAIAVIAGAADQQALILPVSGRLPTLNALVMTANMILAEHIKAGTITADRLSFTAFDTGTDTLDDITDGATYARLLSTEISAGHIRLTSAGVYDTGYDPSTKRRTFTATPTTPYDVGDLWLDASVVKRCTTARASGDYVAGDWTATTLDAIAEGATYGRVLTTDISAGHIVLSSVEQAAGYRTVSDTEKGVWNLKNRIFAQDAIPTSIAAGDLWIDTNDENKPYRAAIAGADQIVAGEWELVRDGEVTQLRTDIAAGTITLSSLTTISGEWYDEAGVEIDATTGINIYGTDAAFTTRATKTGTIQCKVDAAGAIVAGAGAVKFDADGIELSDTAKVSGIGFAKYFYEGIDWRTVFESLDLFDQSGASGGNNEVTISKTGDGGAYFRKRNVNHPITPTWDKDRYFKTKIVYVNLPADANSSIFVGIGHFQANGYYIGFVIQGDGAGSCTLKGVMNDGGVTASTTAAFTTPSGSDILEVQYDQSANTATFKVSGQADKTINTDYPTGTTDAEYLMDWEINVLNDANVQCKTSYWSFLQVP